MAKLYPHLSKERHMELFDRCCQVENTYLREHGGRALPPAGGDAGSPLPKAAPVYCQQLQRRVHPLLFRRPPAPPVLSGLGVHRPHGQAEVGKHPPGGGAQPLAAPCVRGGHRHGPGSPPRKPGCPSSTRPMALGMSPGRRRFPSSPSCWSFCRTERLRHCHTGKEAAP